ncbi:MAG TPA: trypsin-like peptidase domain-containing protein, partial [Miltoncostaeaceae bacterium]|nr:trypsin-like peptidase domain-containing protein [Miltoncostaeaceae bacterium]
PPIPGRRPAAGDGLPPLAGTVPPAPPPVARRRRARPGARRTLRVVAAGVMLLAAGVLGGAVGAGLDGDPPPPPPAAASAPAPIQPARDAGGARLSDAVTLVSPSVVVVRSAGGQGSGVIVAPRNLVVTNQHVVAGSDRVVVVTSDGRSVPARVVVEDARQDLAILQPYGSLPPGVPIAQENHSGLRVGDTVFAVGSPFGLQNSVTAGIVSAVGRTGDGGVPMIQTDAPINPGNSGGGLFDLQGRLVGIPTSIRAPIPGNVGIGFAVPSARVVALLAQVP